MAQLLTQRGIGGAVVVGHSLGGLVALHLANEFPEKVHRLVLVDTATGIEIRALAGIRYLSWLRPFVYAFGYQNRWARRRALLALYADPASVPSDVIDHYLAMARFKGHQEALLRLSRAVARDRAPDLQSIAAPVLVIWGAQDRLVPASRARWLLQGLPAAHLVQVPGAGHMVPEERPEQFEAFVIDFATPEAHAS
jgi:pimeloyl-ACP methyl ester carboxylesterase